MAPRYALSKWKPGGKDQSQTPIGKARFQGNTSVASHDWGKAHVDCCLRGGQSAWGEHQGKNAAALLMLIDAKQERGYKLNEFILKLSLLEKDPQASQVASKPTAQILELLDQPCPRKPLIGRKTIEHVTSERKYQPQVGGGGLFDFGGVGPMTTRERDIARAWRYSSNWSANEYHQYTEASWTWTAAAKNPEIEDIGSLHAGIILTHNGQPFWFSFHVEGKLDSKGKKFRFGHKSKSDAQYTKINPVQSRENIAQKVEGLDEQILQLIKQSAAVTLEGHDAPVPAIAGSAAVLTSA